MMNCSVIKDMVPISLSRAMPAVSEESALMKVETPTVDYEGGPFQTITENA